MATENDRLRRSIETTSSFRGQWFDVPDHISVLLDASVTAEKSHPADTGNALADPFVLVFVRFVH